ncbi:MAG: hypothetical protein KJO08_00165 [Gammaproteobacteria bacterium]|nr:hypothetical protein [Gammaproteobacteria bacterium]NNJ85085.1 hypothetical protein [Gammaproteobacteria bacterium]
MKRIILLFLILALAPLPVPANHGWAGFDVCEVHKDKLPSDLTAESLPDPQSPGAALLNQYCTQCHNLPGPGRHTAPEWREVTSEMFRLMDASHRFGGLMGRVEIMRSPEQEILLAYLERHSAPSANRKEPADSRLWLTRLLVLGSFLLLMGAGLLRWWTNRQGNLRR